jgi:hypothetical protein
VKAILAVVASVRGSTCTVDYPELPELVRSALEARSGRADAIAERNRTRAAETRRLAAAERLTLQHAVHLCVRAPDLTLRQAARAVARRIGSDPWAYGLARKPSIAEVREVLRQNWHRTLGVQSSSAST